MIFLVTSHFINTHATLGDQITRLNEPIGGDGDYLPGEFISIGRDANGSELSGAAIAKQKGSKFVTLIGHLNQGGRLLDPFTQQRECSQCLTEAASALKKIIKAKITEKKFLDTEHEKDEIEAAGKTITALQARHKSLLKMAGDFLKAEKPEQVKAIIAPAPVK